MKTMEKKDYLETLPMPETKLLNSAILKSEFLRVKNKQPMEKINCFEKYD